MMALSILCSLMALTINSPFIIFTASDRVSITIKHHNTQYAIHNTQYTTTMDLVGGTATLVYSSVLQLYNLVYTTPSKEYTVAYHTNTQLYCTNNIILYYISFRHISIIVLFVCSDTTNN